MEVDLQNPKQLKNSIYGEVTLGQLTSLIWFLCETWSYITLWLQSKPLISWCVNRPECNCIASFVLLALWKHAVCSLWFEVNSNASSMCKRRERDRGISLLSPHDLAWHQRGITSYSSLLASPDPRWLLQSCSAISSVFSAVGLYQVWCMSRLGHVCLCYLRDHELVWMWFPEQCSLSIYVLDLCTKAHVIFPLQATS